MTNKKTVKIVQTCLPLTLSTKATTGVLPCAVDFILNEYRVVTV